MNENWKFSDIPYHRPDVEALQARYDALTRRAREAQSPEELVEIVRQRDALQQEVGLCQSIATIRAFHDVTDGYTSGSTGDPAPAGGQPGQPVPGRRHCRKSLCPGAGPGLRPSAAPPADPGPPNSRRGQGPAGPHLPADGPIPAADGLRQISYHGEASQRRTGANRSGPAGPGAPQGRL